MQDHYKIFLVNMPNPHAPSGSGDLVGGRLHVVSKRDPSTTELENLAGSGVRIISLESQREWTHADMKNMGPDSKRELNHQGIVGQVIANDSTDQPFQK